MQDSSSSEDYYERASETLLEVPVTKRKSVRRCCFGLSIPNARLFVSKTLFVWAASFAFIPLIALNNSGRITAVAYATILIALHVLFVVIYFWRVSCRELDPNWRSLAARVLGLLASVYLLYVVAGSLPENLGLLAIDLMGLCLVHTLILLLLTVKVDGAASSSKRLRATQQLPPHAINDDGAILA